MRFSFPVLSVLAMATATVGTDCDDTVDVICASGVHDTLCTAINLAGLTDALNGDGDWTVFGPTDEAFAKLGDKLDEIIADPDLLTNILLFHAVDDRVESSDLECTVLVEMANGQDSRTVCTGHGSNTVFHQKGGGNPSNDMPEIIAVDIETCQGYIHVVDEVMLPGRLEITVPPPDDCVTITEYVCSEDDLSTLCASLEGAGLDDVLDDEDGEFTLFAPTNNAFVRAMDHEPHYFMGRNSCVEYVLLFHAVAGHELYASDLECTHRYEMANGEDSRHVCRGHDVFQKGAGNSDNRRPEIIDTDIRTCNGVIHIVDEVMLPARCD